MNFKKLWWGFDGHELYIDGMARAIPESERRSIRLSDAVPVEPPVLDADGKLVGMAAERDLLIAATRFLQSNVDVGDVMHRGIVTATPGMRLAEAAKLMARERIGGLPVINHAGALVGIITEADILRAFAEID